MAEVIVHEDQVAEFLGIKRGTPIKVPVARLGRPVNLRTLSRSEGRFVMVRDVERMLRIFAEAHPQLDELLTSAADQIVEGTNLVPRKLEG